MEPNLTLILEEMAKLRAEMKECFSKRLNVVTVNGKIRDAHVTNLEEVAAAFDKSFTDWWPGVDSSITAIKLELSKLNSYFNRDTMASSSSSLGIYRSHRRRPNWAPCCF
jgi:hypothetical protein